MKIYEVLLIKSIPNQYATLVSSYSEPKETLKRLFFKNKESADKKVQELENARSTLGDLNYSISIREIDVLD